MKPICFINLILIMSMACFSPATDASESVVHYTTENSGLGSDYIQDIVKTEDGTIWFVHDTKRDEETIVGISGYTGTEWIHVNLEDFPVCDWLSDYRIRLNDVKSFGNTLFIATSQGVFKYEQTTITQIPNFSGFSFSSILPVNDQKFWVSGTYSTWGSRNTISLYDEGEITSYYTEGWVGGHNLLGYDDKSNLWTSGGRDNTNGLFRFDGEQWIWISKDIYGEGMLDLPDGRKYVYSWAGHHSIIDNSSAYRIQNMEGNPAIHSNKIWSVIYELLYKVSDDTVYVYDLYDILPSTGELNDFESIYIALDDSSVWLGSYHQGIVQINYEYLNSLTPDRIRPLGLELIDELPQTLPDYGDDYEYFPMHVGDTWTYSRSMHRDNIGDTDTTTYRDTIIHTIIDTVWVNGEVNFQFLNGQRFRIHHDNNIVYDNGTTRFDFSNTEEETYYYHSPYYPGPGDMTRRIIPLDLPAGQFQGYLFDFSYIPGGVSYATIPHIGVARWEGSGDTPEYEKIELASAIIGGNTIDEIVIVEEPAPYSLELTTYPNPFNPTTTITYTLPTPSPVTLSVYSVTGQKVATLVDEPKAAGVHTMQFDGTGLASGVYFARLEAGGAVETRKMLLVK